MSSGEESNIDWASPSRRRDPHANLTRDKTHTRRARARREDRKQKKPHKYESFNYEKLPRKTGAIRLLRLVPSSIENPNIECELVLQPIEEDSTPYQYEALSWCWGTDSEKTDVHIRREGRIYRKEVSPNLFAALKALRYTLKDRYLWVDAICINQENLEEKNHQVEMMYSIYGGAKRVCVWLGEANKSSQMALDFIKYDVLQLQNFDELCSDEHAGRNWGALLELMQRPWFSRRWVVQEIALARKAVIYCGSDKISWKQFAIAVELFVEVETATHRLSEVMRKASKYRHVPGLFDHVSALGASLLVDATDRLFRDYKEEHRSQSEEDDDGHSSESDYYSESDPELNVPQTPTARTSNEKPSITKAKEDNAIFKKSNMRPLLSLEYLVSSLAIFNTTVPHDTIYALLAISRDTTPRAARSGSLRSSEYARAGLEVFTQRKKYNVDYELPYVDVCREFIEFAIRRSLQIDRSRALDVICRPWATEQNDLDERKRQAQQKEAEQEKERNRKLKRNQAHGPKSANDATQETVVQGEASASVVSNTPKDDDDALIDRRDLPLPSWVPQLSGAPYGMYQQAGLAGEKMSRKNADPLVGLPGSTHMNYAAAETKGLDTQSLRFRKRVTLGHYSMYVRGFELDVIGQVEQVARNGQIPKEWAALANWNPSKGSPPDAFWRTLVADRGRDGKNPPVYYSRACKESFTKGGYEGGAVNTNDLINYELNSVVSQFCRRVQAVVWNRALVKTEKERLGLVSNKVKPGDLVCVLYGLSVPVVLRRSGPKEDKVLEKEVEWELEFLARTVKACWRKYKLRKKRHQWSKRHEMTRMCREWAKDTQWLRYNGMTKEGLKEIQSEKVEKIRKERGVVYGIDLLKRALKHFRKWRAKRREASFLPILIPQLEDALGISDDGQPRAGIPATQLQWLREQHNHSLERRRAFSRPFLKQSGEVAESRPPIDWWAFEYALKAGRRWRKIIADRKTVMISQFLGVAEKWKDNGKGDLIIRLREQHGVLVSEPEQQCGGDLIDLENRHSGTTTPNNPTPSRMAASEFIQQQAVSSRYDEEEQRQTAQTSDSRAMTLISATTNSTLQEGITVDSKPFDSSRTVERFDTAQVTDDPISASHPQDHMDTTSGAQEHIDSYNNASSKLQATPPLSIEGSTGPDESVPSSSGPPTQHVTSEKGEDNPKEGVPADEKKRPSWVPKRARYPKLTEEEGKESLENIKAKIKKQLGKDGQYSYELLGECYIHGMMDGEAMLYQNEGDEQNNAPIPSCVFEIR
ncbi:HET-domain-containing protein [Lentithecium fluviatile CBS 122367]|uniref:HET-domain-containing protein n=1 Tax=Lentithecium fluviatile CBS 122367 TaxID=1168545 RepID=A0A6G1IIX3_9PLEO|nr:HET-domain-containing protein [Lentithecium fluviatile CBS 122367]